LSPGFTIRPDDLASSATRALLALHLEAMRAGSPPGQSFALDLSGLQQPGISVWSAWEGDAILGIAALKRLGGGVGEVKSMRTHPDHLRRGVAASLLRHLVAVARAEGLRQLSLETGSGPGFAAALALYAAHGFVPGPAFGEYEASAFNQFLHLRLAG
jgi:putative acetyltransferase